MKSPKGYMISFEGISGAGKTSAIDVFKSYLQHTEDREVIVKSDLLMYEGEDIGRDIKRLLDKYRNNDPYFQFGQPGVETCLILAKRAHESQTRLLPKLQQGAIVLADRDIDTVCALQLVAWERASDCPEQREFIQTIRKMNAFSRVVPALTFYLDVSSQNAKVRVERREQDKAEGGSSVTKRDVATWERARRNYETCFGVVLDGRELVRIDTDNLDLPAVSDMVVKEHSTWKTCRE